MDHGFLPALTNFGLVALVGFSRNQSWRSRHCLIVEKRLEQGQTDDEGKK